MIEPMLPVVSMAMVSVGPMPSKSLNSEAETLACTSWRNCLVASLATAAAVVCRAKCGELAQRDVSLLMPPVGALELVASPLPPWLHLPAGLEEKTRAK